MRRKKRMIESYQKSKLWKIANLSCKVIARAGSRSSMKKTKKYCPFAQTSRNSLNRLQSNKSRKFLRKINLYSKQHLVTTKIIVDHIIIIAAYITSSLEVSYNLNQLLFRDLLRLEILGEGYWNWIEEQDILLEGRCDIVCEGLRELPRIRHLHSSRRYHPSG